MIGPGVGKLSLQPHKAHFSYSEILNWHPQLKSKSHSYTVCPLCPLFFKGNKKLATQKEEKTLIYFCHTQWCSRFTPGTVLWDYTWWIWDLIWGFNSGWWQARRAPYPLYYRSGPFPPPAWWENGKLVTLSWHRCDRGRPRALQGAGLFQVFLRPLTAWSQRAVPGLIDWFIFARDLRLILPRLLTHVLSI